MKKTVASSKVWIGLGANLGDARSTLQSALVSLDKIPQTQVLCVSSFYLSAPVDANGPDYVNAVACCQTQLAPLSLLHQMQRIESEHGRMRPYYHAPRTLDLDLLLYGDIELASSELTLPHPSLHERAFVLQPLAELDSSLKVPGFGQVADLLPFVKDQKIQKL